MVVEDGWNEGWTDKGLPPRSSISIRFCWRSVGFRLVYAAEGIHYLRRKGSSHHRLLLLLLLTRIMGHGIRRLAIVVGPDMESV